MIKLQAYLTGFSSRADKSAGIKEAKCKNCNRIFFYRYSPLGIQKFCSRKCYGNSIRKHFTAECIVCRKIFAITRKAKKTCSKECLNLRRKSIVFSTERKLAISKSNKLAYKNPELRKLISLRQMGLNNSGRLSILGKNNPRWRGGVTTENHKIRNSIEYKIWRKRVFERDKFTCVLCGKIGGTLNADHIKQFAYFPELRFELSNGRTLCKPCHLKVPKQNHA